MLILFIALASLALIFMVGAVVEYLIDKLVEG